MFFTFKVIAFIKYFNTPFWRIKKLSFMIIFQPPNSPTTPKFRHS
ncbi:hypothetical protein HPSA50_0293 [Helicobacter pylori SouthAfrica50]|uniref:Uncharacterized protein n=1 Tax=Helicobacter pylori SouthAfrica50 TaxID=1352357 RepID=T2SEF7_HELPX|nr:hypothetical protein HPSA50_0293 [Helicobacter pylori SouthAfrica50]